jgi:uncharacterized FlaG/YvyC family protein
VAAHDGEASTEKRGVDPEFLVQKALRESFGGPRQTFARFIVDQDTRDISVQIVDASNQEVIRTIPNEDLRKIAQQLHASNGVMLDSAV